MKKLNLMKVAIIISCIVLISSTVVSDYLLSNILAFVSVIAAISSLIGYFYHKDKLESTIQKQGRTI